MSQRHSIKNNYTISNKYNNINNRISTNTTMRIRNQDLLLGVILFLGLSPRAYTLNNIFHAPRSMQQSSLLSPLNKGGLFNNFAVTTTSTILSRPASNLLLFQHTSPSIQEDLTNNSSLELEFTVEAKRKELIDNTRSTQNKLTTIATAATFFAMAVLFGVSQLVGGGTSPKVAAAASATTASADDGRLLLYSAVSATLLRREKGDKWKLLQVQNILLCWALFQGAQQFGRGIQCLWTLGGIFSTWYTGVLYQFPLITKSLTTAVIGVLGDTAAQFLEQRVRAKKDGTNMEPLRHYDQRRGLAVLGDSLLISGPLLHVAYDMLESFIPVAGPHASLAALSHVLIDNFLLDAVFVAVMFVSTGIVEGYTKQIIPQLKKDYFKTMKTGWATSIALMPLVFVCFRFLPLSFRVLGMNIIDIFWEAIISHMVHRRRRTAKLQATIAPVASTITTTTTSTTTTSSDIFPNKGMPVLVTEGAAIM
jgi:Mpv17 / PMP22 family